MAKITRYDGNLLPFAQNFTGGNRTIFGETTQSNDITDNINNKFLQGWEATTDANTFPTKQDFNAVAYVSTVLASYLHQVGIPEWNGTQEYHENSFTNFNGVLYRCKTNDHTSVTDPASDATNWEDVLGNFVSLTGNEDVDGVKTFLESPIVPTPTAGAEVANKDYVDSKVNDSVVSFNDSVVSTESGWSSQKIVDAINDGTTGAYGVRWNQETDVYELLGATNRTQIQSQMRRCVLHNDASSTAAVGDTSLSGTVNYYLDPNDSTLKEDGVTASVLDGTDGNVMVEIPKFYYKHELNGNDHQWWVSPAMDTGFSLHPAFMREGTERDFRYYRAYKGYNSGGTLLSRSGVTPTRSQTIGTFRTQAMANGTGWSQNDFNLMFAVQLLFLTEFGTLNTQATLGSGNDTGENYGLTTGQSNGIGNGSSGPLNNNMWMSYRGIENWYADIWEFVDGINIKDYEVFLNDNPSTFASNVFTGDYVSTGTFLLAGASNTFIKKLADSNQGFFPSESGGSSSTYLTDAFWSASGNRILLFGGSADGGASGGGFSLGAHNDSALSAVTRGAGVSF